MKLTESKLRKIIREEARKLNEGKKRYRIQWSRISSGSKYSVSYHNGKSKHKDGSDFFDIKLFKNKPSLEQFVKDLKGKGYKEQ